MNDGSRLASPAGHGGAGGSKLAGRQRKLSFPAREEPAICRPHGRARFSRFLEMSALELVHCIYCSAAASGAASAAELSTILESARRNNARLEVSGILLYQDGAFFQVLEGEPTVIERLFNTISADPRHRRVTKIVLEAIADRSFAEWTMGYPKITRAELTSIPGLNDFFGRGHSLLELEEGRAKTLLSAFEEGRWRLSIS
jgi:hypothetical protein